jgi:hypothetical protein
LDATRTATARALQPGVFHVVENPRAFLESSPLVCLHICEVVARRLDELNQYFVDVKRYPFLARAIEAAVWADQGSGRPGTVRRPSAAAFSF